MKDISKWLEQQQAQAQLKQKDPNSYVENGVEYDIKMSMKFGDEWFFNLINSDMQHIVPGLCIDSAVHSVATDCLVNLFLNGYSEEDLQNLFEQAVELAKDVQKRNE